MAHEKGSGNTPLNSQNPARNQHRRRKKMADSSQDPDLRPGLVSAPAAGPVRTGEHPSNQRCPQLPLRWNRFCQTEHKQQQQPTQSAANSSASTRTGATAIIIGRSAWSRGRQWFPRRRFSRNSSSNHRESSPFIACDILLIGMFESSAASPTSKQIRHLLACSPLFPA